jgi:ribosomal protein S18 acetylase RimI-like enzyme
LSSNNIQPRKAVLEDSEALVSCIDAAYAKYSNRISEMPSVSDGIIEDITHNQVWVAVEADEIIACLVLIKEDGFMKLANLAVHPSHSGKGIGRKLMALSEREAKRQGYNEMRLNTHVDMPENIQLYEYLGWEEVSRIKSTVSMKKRLGL